MLKHETKRHQRTKNVVVVVVVVGGPFWCGDRTNGRTDGWTDGRGCFLRLCFDKLVCCCCELCVRAIDQGGILRTSTSSSSSSSSSCNGRIWTFFWDGSVGSAAAAEKSRSRRRRRRKERGMRHALIIATLAVHSRGCVCVCVQALDSFC